MFIDICVLALLVMAIFKGAKQGLVVAACSFAAIFIGLAAAVKMSAIVAKWLGESVNIQASWLPFLAFIIIMLVVAIAVSALAKVIETTLQAAMLGWFNKLGGILLYIALYLTVFSVLIFYIEQMQLLKPNMIAQSTTYPYIHLWGPESIQLVGKAIPYFKGMFTELSSFFGSLAKKGA